MIAIIDYDAGNIKSVEKAFHHLGEHVVVTRNPMEILQADRAVLPGVGSFGDAMEHLQEYQLIPVIHKFVESGRPFLGICLGMQVLFDESEESKGVTGLQLLKGKIVRFPEKTGLKIPHMGWNSLHYQNGGRLFCEGEEKPYVYFVHSYYLQAEDRKIVKASADYGVEIHAAVESGNLFGCQFHPEKSSACGLAFLKRFAEMR